MMMEKNDGAKDVPKKKLFSSIYPLPYSGMLRIIIYKRGQFFLKQTVILTCSVSLLAYIFNLLVIQTIISKE